MEWLCGLEMQLAAAALAIHRINVLLDRKYVVACLNGEANIGGYTVNSGSEGQPSAGQSAQPAVYRSPGEPLDMCPQAIVS